MRPVTDEIPTELFEFTASDFRAIGPLFIEILHFQEFGGYKNFVTNAVWVLIYSLTICLCIFRYFTTAYNLKAIRPLLMEILKIWGITECHLAANAVVLVPVEHQISIATYFRGVSTRHIKFERYVEYFFELERRRSLRSDAAAMLKP